MPEPVTMIGSLALGMLGSYLANRVDDAQRPLLELITSRLKRGGAELPPNHDVDHACRQSLKQAIELMAQAMDLRVVEPANLREAIRNRYDSDGNWKPLFDRWHTEEGNWLREFLQEVRSADSLKRFDLRPISGAASLNFAVRSEPDDELEQHFIAAMLDWTERRVQTGKAPDWFREWVTEGWPIAPDMPGVRVTLYQAWCLFFQDELKHDEHVFRILTTDWLSGIDSRLSTLNFDRDELTGWMGGQLGEQRELLEDLRDLVSGLVAHVEGLGNSVGQLIAVVALFRDEVGSGMSELKTLLADQNGLIVKLDGKADQSLDNQQLILQKLNQLVDRDASTSAPQSAETEAPRSSLIADSRLLDSDGAARLTKLIGRDVEKGNLTRAWNAAGLNIVVLVAWGGVGKTALVTDWFSRRFNPHWSGVDAFFDWTFYSQGTRDQSAANSDAFLAAALTHFGDSATASSGLDADSKARRLAELIVQQRTLLILDGVEPLQHPKKPHGLEGRFKDPGIERLLKCLAQSPMPGLCVVTTREPIVDLQPFHTTTVREYRLQHLTVKRGAELLHQSGANRAGDTDKDIGIDDPLLLDTAKEARGHALTLQLMGGYLRQAHGGDIRRKDRINFAKVFEGQLEGHAYNVMEAYERWFEEHGVEGQRQLAVLRLTGLFDRSADAGCLKALRQRVPGESSIEELTGSLTGLDDDEWLALLKKLEDHGLLSIVREPGTEAVGVDAHPLIREYFAEQLRQQQSAAFLAAHSRLFDHLCETTEHQPDTLPGLQPLYQAVTHGCLAGRQQEACHKVYFDRIVRGNAAFSIKKLGAISADLGAVAAFFASPWRRLSPNLSEAWQAWLLNEAATRLHALGRLAEAREPMLLNLKMRVDAEEWYHAASSASNLSELEATLGEVSGAVGDAEQSVTYADLSGDAFLRLCSRITHADALHQRGERGEARALFEEAERMQAERQPQLPLLYSLRGFWYADLILAPAERAAWQRVLNRLTAGPAGRASSDTPSPLGMGLNEDERTEALAACAEAAHRASEAVEIAKRNGWLLDIAMDHLTLARAGLYRAILESVVPAASALQAPAAELDLALNGLRQAGQLEFVAKALLTASLLETMTEEGGRMKSEQHLAEAQQIAERGPMPLYLADVHLHRARLCGASRLLSLQQGEPPTELSWESVRHDFAEAKRLIDKHHYGRRREELADAEFALRPRISE